MFIARFLTGPGTDKTPYNVRISFLDYLIYLCDTKTFLVRLNNRYHKDFLNGFYFKECVWNF